ANVDVLGNDPDPTTDGDGNLPTLVYGYSSSYTSSDLQITNHLDRLTLTSYTLGDHTISYTAYDRSGGQATATVTAHVIDDCNPVAHDLNITTAPGAPVTFDFLAGTATFHNADACADYGDPSAATNKLYSFGYNSKVGVIKRNPDGTFTYTPAAGYTGTWSTTFMIQNSLTKLLDRANITFTIQ
ncbi:MAG: cadherin-like domain-containing protein, partial [Deltaproteobacteria bacterium]|nr:cadherin-like domain-containing protein [Deltaproteobacteria bacterium]